MKQVFSFVLKLIVLGAVVVGAAVWALDYNMKQPVDIDTELHYHFKTGSNVKTLVNDLKSQGIVEFPVWIEAYIRVNKLQNQLKAGEYEIKPGMTGKALVDLLVSGDVIKRHVQFINGKTFKEMLKTLKATDGLKQTFDGDVDALMAELGAPGVHPEGQFYPDTYQYESGMSDVDILRHAHERLKSVLADEWEKRSDDLPYDSPYEALIMASIVEKETGMASERPEIAGVFVRRLKKNMRLETDPTVIYGMGDDYKGNIRKSDLRKKTPYNTYRIFGLPPTPIAMVARSAINAALHPNDGDALFFVAKGDGSHYFSATYKEHKKAVQKYQIEKRKKNYSSAPQEQ